MTMRTLRRLAAAALLAAAVAPAHAAFSPAVEVTPGSVAQGGSLQFVIRTTGEFDPLAVTVLGFYSAPGLFEGPIAGDISPLTTGVLDPDLLVGVFTDPSQPPNSDLSLSGLNKLDDLGAPMLIPADAILFQFALQLSPQASIGEQWVTFRFAIDDVEAGDARATFQITAVPEPSTWALLGAGLALLGWAARRRSA